MRYLKSIKGNLLRKKIDRRYHKVYEIARFKDAEEFLKDIESDLKLFEFLNKEIDKVGLSSTDPKAERLIEGVKDFPKEKRKVVIFTEYLDTTTYLDDILTKSFSGLVLSVYGNLSRSKIEVIYENFDAQYKKQKDDYQILLTTDKLSEEFNLNRAGAVINYDIP